MRTFVLIAFLLIPPALFAQNPADDDEEPAAQTESAKGFQFKVGKFKMPFGMEENTSSDRLDFVYRSQVTNYLAGARERGAMLHGKLLKGKRLGYQVGVFRFDGENSDIQGVPTAGRTYAARLS